MEIKVAKASGLVEDLDTAKLRASLIRSGADIDEAEEIIEIVLSKIEHYTSTKRIYRLAKKYLRQVNRASGLRYSLKSALFRLGPSGYPFERYIGELMRRYGYHVNTDVFLEGKCIRHEIDVLAVKDNEISLVECKYHNTSGNFTDVKVAMYIHSRFEDLWPVLREQHHKKQYKGWLVTNTRCTSDAIRYAECIGMNVVGWRYPKDRGLQEMIEDKKLYPVTIISGVKSSLIKKLIEYNILLLKDLGALEVKDIQEMLLISDRQAVALKEQANQLFSG
jgi:hypothetical protein